MIIKLGLELWEALNNETHTDDDRVTSIGDFIDDIIPMLKKDEAKKLTDIVGDENENLPALFEMAKKLTTLFDDK